MLFLRDIQVVLNPDSNFRAVVPILLTTPIDVDLGTVVLMCPPPLLFIPSLFYSYHRRSTHPVDYTNRCGSRYSSADPPPLLFIPSLFYSYHHSLIHIITLSYYYTRHMCDSSISFLSWCVIFLLLFLVDLPTRGRISVGILGDCEQACVAQS